MVHNTKKSLDIKSKHMPHKTEQLMNDREEVGILADQRWQHNHILISINKLKSTQHNVE